MGFHSYYIRGRLVSKEEAIGVIISCGGWIPTFAGIEADNLSKAICSDGKEIWKEDFFGNRLERY